MRTRAQNLLREILHRVFPSAVDSTSLLPSDEQTRLSWARRVETYEAVPGVYQDFFAPYRAAGQEFPYTIQSPSYEGFFHRATEKLICDLGTTLYILEKSGNTYTVVGYPLDKISYVETRSVLLDSYIKISGVTQEGRRAATSARFNTVTDYLFTPIVERVRGKAVGAPAALPSPEAGAFAHLVNINYKFMNYGRRSMLGGEKLIHFILQPEIRTPVLTFLGRTYYRTVFPTHMSILTDKELIMIREEARQSGKDRYGGIWDYIPLDKVESLSLNMKGANHLSLAIQLPEQEHLEYLYQASARPDIERLLEGFAQCRYHG